MNPEAVLARLELAVVDALEAAADDSASVDDCVDDSVELSDDDIAELAPLADELVSLVIELDAVPVDVGAGLDSLEMIVFVAVAANDEMPEDTSEDVVKSVVLPSVPTEATTVTAKVGAEDTAVPCCLRYSLWLSGAAMACSCICRCTSSICWGTCRRPDAECACGRCSTPWENCGVGATSSPESCAVEYDNRRRLCGGAISPSIRRYRAMPLP